MIIKFIKNYIFPGNVREAKRILTTNTNVLYGIFGVIKDSGYFPPREFLNEFLESGSDPCDQDERMSRWAGFTLSREEYSEIKEWWLKRYPNSKVSNLNTNCWDDWSQEVYSGHKKHGLRGKHSALLRVPLGKALCVKNYGR